MEKLAVIVEKLETLEHKMRSTELESFAEATCCNQHQRHACILSATSVKNKQEMQADYHARTKAE